MTTASQISTHPRLRWTVPATVLALGMILFATSDLSAQNPNEDRIWAHADTAVLLYMRLSVPAIAEGYNRGHKRFYDWYVNTHLPSLDNEPPISKVFAFAFGQAIKSGGPRLLPGPLGSLAVGLFQAAQQRLDAPENATLPPDRYLVKLEAQLADDRAAILTLADRFEQEQPTFFEDAMTAYLHEELETPGIHAASDFRMGERTRQKLRELGFPEPGAATTSDVAERLLTRMIFATKRRAFPDGLDAELMQVDAQITARRILYPSDPKHYCEDAWKLGMLAPDDCR